MIREAIELNPNNPFTYVSLGTIMYDAGRKRETQQAYEKAIAMDPHNFDAHYYLAHLFNEQHKMTEAAIEFEKAIAIDSTDADSHQQLDSIHLLMKRNVKEQEPVHRKK